MGVVAPVVGVGSDRWGCPVTATMIPSAVEDAGTPESQRLSQLEAMLDDPDYAGFRAEIQRAIDELRATAVLGA